MQTIKCELCGSNQLIKKDGYYQCEFCGTKYTLEEAKKLIVSGTVEVVTGNAEKERLIKNAEMHMKLGNITSAKEVWLKITTDFPNDYHGWVGLAKINQLNISSTFRKLEENLSDPYNSKDISILSELQLISKNKGIINDISIEHANEINSIENSIINQYNSIRDLPLVNAISSEIICNYKKMQNFSNTMRLWADNLTTEFINAVFSGKSSFQMLFRLRGDKEKLLSPKSYDDGNQNFNKLFLIGKQCAQFLNSHKYILEDILLEDISIFNYEKEVLFAFGNTLSIITDREYGIVTTEYKTMLIKNIETLQKIAEQKNPNKYCHKCGAKLQGVFNKVCSNCGKPKNY